MTSLEHIRSTIEEWEHPRIAAVMARIRAERARQAIQRTATHPADLAKLCDPSYTITPAVEMVSRAVEQVLRGRGRNLLITAPPQEFKSYLCAVWTPLRALQLHPEWRVMLLTYADGLAEEHSGLAKAFIEEFGTGAVDALTGAPLIDRLGYQLNPSKGAVANWRILEGGGLVAAGRDASITGRRADLLIIDDPYKNMQEADSAAIRHKVDTWYRSVARTRLAAGASTILIQTRWHPDDLAATILKEQKALPPSQRSWRYLNVPAIRHRDLPDALEREHGTPLESARGRTLSDWQEIERSVGKRVWNALYQGSPVVPEGGLFSGQWFDDHRMADMPDNTLVRIVAVDPAESGEGDEAGVIGAALLAPLSADSMAIAQLMAAPGQHLVYPQVLLTHDRSAQMTSDEWAKAAVDLAIETWASDIVVEAYTAGLTYINVVRNNIYNRLWIDQGNGQRKERPGLDPAVRAHLSQLFHRVRRWREPGDAVARSGLLRQAIETGTCAVLADELSVMESQARQWNAGQHQPDRVAAAVIAHDHLVKVAGQVATMAPPTQAQGARQAPAWMSRKVG